MKTDCDVIVVGAGYAGLIAARNLIEAGKRVIILEAGSRVGGRCWSENYPGTDKIVDWGAEWVLPAHHHALMAEA
ncbi:MAG: FAD-dependent oxidoreductase, partial [Notoacmeibacter sp.]